MVALENSKSLPFLSSELVLNSSNQVYHLGISPENIADTVILVGDQDRVGQISRFFDTLLFQSRHREFVCHTGIFGGKKISALSTGIGTDNIDIVVNELDALVNIDFESKQPKKEKKKLNLIRIGTCGLLQKERELGSYILSEYALGLDNVAWFYEIKNSIEEERILGEVVNKIDFPPKVHPYLFAADKTLLDTLSSKSTTTGITITASGFYGPQGRELRLPLAKKNLRNELENLILTSNNLENFEMESSALYALSRGLGHKAVTICLGIANRPTGDFLSEYSLQMDELIEYVLKRI